MRGSFGLTAVGVQVKRREVQRCDVKVISPYVATGRGSVRVTAIVSIKRSETLVADGHHVVGIQRLDVLGGSLSPVVNHGADQMLVSAPEF